MKGKLVFLLILTAICTSPRGISADQSERPTKKQIQQFENHLQEFNGVWIQADSIDRNSQIQKLKIGEYSPVALIRFDLFRDDPYVVYDMLIRRVVMSKLKTAWLNKDTFSFRFKNTNRERLRVQKLDPGKISIIKSLRDPDGIALIKTQTIFYKIPKSLEKHFKVREILEGRSGPGIFSFQRAAALQSGEGKPVPVVSPGIVVRADINRGGFGGMVIVNHGKGVATGYLPLSKIVVKPGMRVRKGQVMGIGGKSSKWPYPFYRTGVFFFIIWKGLNSPNPYDPRAYTVNPRTFDWRKHETSATAK